MVLGALALEFGEQLVALVAVVSSMAEIVSAVLGIALVAFDEVVAVVEHLVRMATAAKNVSYGLSL